jgi:hypothetical protein
MANKKSTQQIPVDKDHLGTFIDNSKAVDTERNQYVSARVTTEIKDKLKALAADKNMSMSDYIFYVLTNHIRGRDRFVIFSGTNSNFVITPRKTGPKVDDNEDYFY